MSNAKFLETALKAAVSAGNMIEERHRDILNVSRKESLRDIVTHVDKLPENQIIDTLNESDDFDPQTFDNLFDAICAAKETYLP